MSWLKKWLAWKSASPLSRRPTPADSAADSLLNKTSKLRLGQEALMLRHMREVAHDDVDSVRRLKAKHLGPHFASAVKEGEDVGDIIIGDDIHLHEPRGPLPPSRAWPVIAGLTLGGALVALGLTLPPWLARKATEQPANQQPAMPAPATSTTIKSGFILDLPGGK